MPDKLRKSPTVLLLILTSIGALGAVEIVLQIERPGLHDRTYSRVPGPFSIASYAEDREFLWSRPFGNEVEGVRFYCHQAKIVYVLGGSIAEGLSGPLFACLKERGVSADGFNLACGGWTTYQALRQFRRFIGMRAPTHAVLTTAYNDSRLGPVTDVAQAESNRRWSRRLLFGLNQTRLFTLGRRFLARAVEGREPRPITPRVPVDLYRKNLEDFVHLAHGVGAIPILVTEAFPYDSEREDTAPYFVIMESVARATGALFVDVRPAFEALGVLEISARGIDTHLNEKQQRFWGDLVHPTEAGSRVKADLIYDAVAARGGWN